MSLELRKIPLILETINRKLHKETEIRTQIYSLISECETVGLQFKSAVTNEGERVLRQKRDLELSQPSEVDIDVLETQLKRFKNALENAETNAEAMKTNTHCLVEVCREKVSNNKSEIRAKRCEVSELSFKIDLLQLDITACENEATLYEYEAGRLTNLADELKERAQREKGMGWGIALLSYGAGLTFAPVTGGASLYVASGVAGFNLGKHYASAKECEADATVARRKAEDKTYEADSKKREKEFLLMKTSLNETDFEALKMTITELGDVSDALEQVLACLFRGIDTIRMVKLAVQDVEAAMHKASLEGNTFEIFQRAFLRNQEKLARPAQRHLETLQDKWEKIEEVLKNI